MIESFYRDTSCLFFHRIHKFIFDFPLNEKSFNRKLCLINENRSNHKIGEIKSFVWNYCLQSKRDEKDLRSNTEGGDIQANK